MRNILAFLTMALAGGAGLAQPSQDLGPKPPGDFDYYVLALTWVPAFCATNHDPQECGHDTGFALHGLWPNYDNGNYPSSCAEVALTQATRETFETIYASPKMIEHEWSKHGTCSGLAPADYFTLSKTDAAFVVVPPAYRTETSLRAADSRAVAAAFIAANPGLVADDFTVITKSDMVSEIRFCITKATAFRSCKAK